MVQESGSAIVTGGASGLGRATAEELAARGASVIVVDRDVSGARVAEGIGGRFVECDVADADAVQRAVDAAVDLAPLRVLVNCAGIGRSTRTVGRDGATYPLERFELVLRVNLVGTFNCVRLAAAAMSQNEPLADGARGSIVNTASIAAFEGQVGQVAYAASKGGIVGMTLPCPEILRPSASESTPSLRASSTHRSTARGRVPQTSRLVSVRGSSSRLASVARMSSPRWWWRC